MARISGRGRGGQAGGNRGANRYGKSSGGRGRGAGKADGAHRGRGKAGAGRGAQDSVRTRKPATQRSDFIEGRRAVAEALDARVPLRRALLASGGEADATLAELARRLERAGVRVEEVPRSRLDKLSSHGAHQGIVVEAQPFAYASLRRIIERAGDGPALVIILDHVTDEGNFGAIVRSAEVVGAAGVIVANARAARVGVGAYKTSAGAVLHLPIAQISNLAKAIEELKEAGFWAAGATEHASQSCWDAPLEGRIALVMGSEGDGLTRLTRDRCDFLCKLPQRGITESLNVAQAATVLSYEWLRRSFGPEPPAVEHSFGDAFDIGGDAAPDLPSAGATGRFRPLELPQDTQANWGQDYTDDLDIGGDRVRELPSYPDASAASFAELGNAPKAPGWDDIMNDDFGDDLDLGGDPL